MTRYVVSYERHKVAVEICITDDLGVAIRMAMQYIERGHTLPVTIFDKEQEEYVDFHQHFRD